MASRTGIEYLTHTANPYSGCKPISAGCLNCWAKETAPHIARQIHNSEYAWALRKHGDAFYPGVYHPNWAKGLGGKPKIVGVNFMGDLFGGWVNENNIHNVIIKLSWSKNHYLFLTKRGERLRNILISCSGLAENGNFWFGVSICNQADWDKNAGYLREIKARGFKTWISFEPLLEEIFFGKDQLPADWVVVGGESGKGARYMNTRWAADIGIKADNDKTPFYFKQWGDAFLGRSKDTHGIENIKQLPPGFAEILEAWK